MGFDQHQVQPLIHPRRWGTKVNIGMALGIAIFLILGVITISHIRSRNKEVTKGAHQESENKH